jgi:DNA mismatch repair ATPase MutL
MMQEISLYIFDIEQNSISADAKNITIILKKICLWTNLTIEIKDDGKGMSEDFLAQVTSPLKQQEPPER